MRALYRNGIPTSLRNKVYLARMLARVTRDAVRGTVDADDLAAISKARLAPSRAMVTERRIVERKSATVVERFMEFARACEQRSEILAADVYVAHGVEALPGAWHVNRRQPGRLMCDAIEVPSFGARAVKSRWDDTTLAFLDRSFEGFLRDADAILTVGWELGRRLERYGAPVHVVPNYRNAETLVRTNTLRERCGLAPDDRLILVMSGVATGFEDVLLALQSLKENVHIACVGRLVPDSYDAAMRERVRSMGLSARVHFFEPVPYEELTGFVSAADVGLMVRDPSIENNYVSLPNRVFDYAASGLPIITPNIPDIAQIVTERNFGLVIDSISADAWRDGIRRCIERQAEMSANALAASHQMTWDVVEPDLLTALGRPSRVTFFGIGDLTKNNRTLRMSRSLVANGAIVKICTERSTMPNPPEGVEIHLVR